jgi:predicted RNA-binding protein with PUA-like domain
MRSGDHAYIYHTGDEKAVVGLAKVVAEAYADPAEAKAGKPTLNGKGELAAPVVDLMPVRAVHPVTLAALKADARFKACGLVTQGRLSVIKLSEGEAKALASLCG